MTDQTVVNFGELEVRGNGQRQGVFVSSYANVLTGEQKIDRDLLFRVARLLPLVGSDFAVTLYDGSGNDVLRFNAFALLDGKAWDISAHKDGKKENITEQMSETKRPGKGGKAGEIDTGPAVLKMVTAVLKHYNIPIVQIAAESGPRVSKTATQIATLEGAIAQAESLKTGNATTDAVIEGLVAALRTQVGDLSAKVEKGKNLQAAKKAKAAGATPVAVAASPLGKAASNAK